MFYGLSSEQNLAECVKEVCDCLGHGKYEMAVDMLLETAAAETHSGQLEDGHAMSHGVGVFQIDRIAFEDTQARTRIENIDKIRRRFGIDIHVIQYEMLAFSPLLSAIFCRLFYKLVPDIFPRTYRERANYWKTHYNTAAGAGSVNEYLERAATWKVRRVE